MTDWQPRRLREALLNDIEHRLQEGAGDIELQFDRARILTELGRTEEAKVGYLNILQQAPDHFGTLNNLGALLYTTGFRTAARTVYAEVVRQHPHNPTGHVNLANALLADGELDPARSHYMQALALAPEHAEAHQGFANLLMEAGEEEAARTHRQRGYQNQTLTILPYRGKNKPLPVILLIAAAGGNVPIQRFLDDQIFLTTVIAAEFYDAKVSLPAHRLLVNAIGDADLSQEALRAAAAIAAKTTAPVINAPAAVLPTGRVDIARRFASTPGIIAPRMFTLRREELSQADALTFLTEKGFTPPFLIRAPGFHTGRHFYQINEPSDLAKALESIPGRDMMLIEYLDSRGPDGKIRKYRVMMIGGRLYPLHVAISQQWKIHYFTAEMADNAEHRAEDAAFLENMANVLGPRAMQALEHICRTLNLDYAGIDFGLNAAGDLLLFEANATMVVNPPEPDPRWAYRRPAVERINEAVQNLLQDKIAT